MEKRLREILAHHDYHSSISSNFSLFNPKDELKSIINFLFRFLLKRIHGKVSLRALILKISYQ